MLLALGFSQIGYYIFSIGYQSYLKEEMKEIVLSKIDKKQLTLICYTDNAEEIKWENSTEFSFKKNIFDLVRRDTINRKIYLYCINDKKEAELIAKYNAATKNQHSGKKNLGKEKNTIIFCDQFKSFVSPKVNVCIAQNTYSSRLHSTYENITTPPPKYFI